MKSKQTTEEIQTIISNQKDAAKRLATALFAAATIGAGVTLTGCDTISPINNPDTTNEIPGEVPSEEITSEFASEEVTTTEVTEEQTTTPVEEINYEEELIKLLAKDYPEYENGIFAFCLCKFDEGSKYESFTLSLCCNDENGEQYFTDNICIIDFDRETFNQIFNNIKDGSIEVYPGQFTLYTNNLSPETFNYIYKTYYDLYVNQLNSQLSPEQ
jgi:hypothetical protein